MSVIGDLHYKGPENEIVLPWYGGESFFDATGVMTPEQIEDLKNGKRVEFVVDDVPVEMWVTT